MRAHNRIMHNDFVVQHYRKAQLPEAWLQTK